MSVVRLSAVSVQRGGALLLDGVSLTLLDGERWVVIGPNGAGKTTLLQIMAARLFPTRGDVEVLGEALGATDIPELRPRIGFASAAHLSVFPPAESVANAVLSGAYDVTGRWREKYDPADEARAATLLTRWGLAPLAQRTLGTLSEGERKRTLIARALMADPELLLLDEPGAGLDLAGREDLVARLGELARTPSAPVIVQVTHHVEEIPDGFTHAVVLGRGRVVAAGPLPDVLTSTVLSAAFGLGLDVTTQNGRYWARRAEIPGSRL